MHHTSTVHSMDRVLTRLPEIGIDPRAFLHRAEKIARKHESIAVEMARFQQVMYLSDGTNGDRLWLVVKDHRMVTVLLRREGQDCSAAKFGVERTARLALPVA